MNDIVERAAERGTKREKVWAELRIASGQCPAYLSENRSYAARLTDPEGQRYNIRDDRDREQTIWLKGCFHLNGGDWSVLDE